MGLGIENPVMVAFLVASWQLDSKVRSTILPAGLHQLLIAILLWSIVNMSYVLVLFEMMKSKEMWTSLSFSPSQQKKKVHWARYDFYLL